MEIETGKVLGIHTLAKSDIDADGMRECFFEFNGQLRTHKCRDTEASKVRHERVVQVSCYDVLHNQLSFLWSVLTALTSFTVVMLACRVIRRSWWFAPRRPRASRARWARPCPARSSS